MLTRKVRSYAADEPGIQGEAVTLSQWYWDGAEWVRNETFGVDGFNALEAIATDEWAAGAALSVDDPTTVDLNEAGYVTVRTNADGLYRFQNLPTAYVNESGELFLASYRLTLDGLEQQEVEQGGTVVSRVPWLMTRYHAGAAVAVDSDIDDALDGTLAVSYTHLDVYKRQLLYKHSTFADTMPHEGDKETSNFDVTTKTYSLRQSQWSGWLQDLDSIKMEYTDTTPTEEGDIKGKYELRIASAKDPVTGQTLSPQASVWVGPIATAGTGANVKYTPLTTDDIYEPCLLYTSRCV